MLSKISSFYYQFFFIDSLDKSPENVQNLNALRPRILQIVRKGAISALDRGPRVGGQVVNTQIRLHNVVIGRGTADSFIMATATQCVQKVGYYLIPCPRKLSRMFVKDPTTYINFKHPTAISVCP